MKPQTKREPGPTGLEDLNISARLARLLAKAGIRTLEDVVPKGRAHWQESLRPTLFRELLELLEDHGLELDNA